MSKERAGHLSADVISAGGLIEFRVTQRLYYYERSGMHCIEADDAQSNAFYAYLPAAIESGSYQLGIGQEGAPMIIHVTDNAEAELYPGVLELTVGGDAQFAGIFRGTDANGVEVENGSFRMEHDSTI